MAKKRKRVVKKNMEEKGISPLIATVLLIGFTVALAAIIITWGGRFIGTTTERVETQTEAQLTCTEVDFKITDVSCGTGKVDVTIDNRASVEIASLIFRVYSETTTTPVEEKVIVTGDMDLDMTDTALDDPLTAFNVETYKVGGYVISTNPTITLGSEISGEKVTKVEAIPKISIGAGTSPQSCSQMIESFEPTACTV